MTWIEEYAEALGTTLDEAHREAILDLARDVAHGTERMNAPLASFLAGLFVGRGEGDLGEALRRARALMPKTDGT